MQVSISETLRKSLYNIQLGCLTACIENSENNEQLWQVIENQTQQITKLSTEDIKKIPQIATTRQAFKLLGKEPSRYRPSAEALMRRIILNKSLYKINTAVDIINLASISTGYSIGGYDISKIVGDIVMDKAQGEFLYEAIGRGQFNIDGLPVFFDDLGPFGSPVSDSIRTCIDINSSEILLIVMNFGGHSEFEKSMQYIAQLFYNYCKTKSLTTKIID